MCVCVVDLITSHVLFKFYVFLDWTQNTVRINLKNLALKLQYETFCVKLLNLS